MRNFYIALLLVLIATGFSQAQNFEERFIKYSSTILGSESGCTFLDYNGDGQMDVLAGWASKKHLMLMQNRGNTFSFEALADSVIGYAYFKRLDFDGDGMEDYLVSVRNNSGSYDLYVCINQGNGSFTPHFVHYTGFDRVEQVEVADIDGDGDNDLVIDVFANFNAFYLVENQGNYNFTWSYLNFTGQPSELYGVADMDGDGLVDVVGAYLDFSISQYRIVVKETDTTGGNISFTEHTISTRPYTREGVVGQFTGTALPDVIISANTGGNTLTVFGNSGNFNFSIAAQPAVATSSVVHLPRDYDGDGDLDVLLRSNQLDLLENGLANGTGWSTSTLIANYANHPKDWADVNGDGLNDLLLGVTGAIEVWTQQPNGTYQEYWRNDNVGRYNMEITDIDMNGKNDVVMTNNEDIYEVLQTASEQFLSTSIYSPSGLPSSTTYIRDIQLFDKEGDGDDDMLVTYNTDIYLLTNNNGTYQASLVSSVVNGVTEIDTADFDGDGNLEFVVFGTPSVLLEWNGTAFTSTSITLGGDNFAIMDADGDGDKDIIFPDWTGTQYELRYLQNNSGAFTSVLIGNIHSAVTAGILHNTASGYSLDYDGDGDEDYFILNQVGEEVNIMRNDGSGSFTPLLFTDSLTSPMGLLFFDADGDNDKDILISELTTSDIILFENLGSGSYSSSVFTEEAIRPEVMQAVDFDKDGDIDILSMSWIDDRLLWLENKAIDCPRVFTTIHDSICPGDSIFLGGAFRSQPGQYIDSLVSQGGCDSILTTDLALYPQILTSETLSICEGDSVMVYGQFVSQPGVYSDTTTAVNGCDSIHEIQVAYFSTPNLSLVVKNILPTDVVFEATAGWANYDWYESGTLLQSGPHDTLTVNNAWNGMYIEVFVTSADGCTDSTNLLFELESIAESEAQVFNVFPNPTQTEFRIDWEVQQNLQAVYLLDIEGKTVRRWSGDSQSSYDVSDIPDGLYFVRIQTDDAMFVRRLVVRR